MADVEVVKVALPNGITMTGDRRGDAADPVVILLHGGGQTRHAWGSALISLAAAGWNAYSFDLRGHGDSTWSADNVYDLERFSGDVAMLARSFDRPVLVGASLGGLASRTFSKVKAADGSGTGIPAS